MCNHATKQQYLLTPATICTSAIIILCVMTLTSFLFIEMVAYFTEKAVSQMATFIVATFDRDLEIPRNCLPPLPLLLHQLIDRICPLSTHTPAELPEQGYLFFPPKMRSPCSLCVQGIGMGELCRTLPCGHTFHARCVDKHCLAQGTTDRTSCVTCPTCRFVVYPTPDLMNDIAICARPDNYV
ncbi:E3 ubiquitin-protein ligase SDIR1 [Gracilariopsis chorda]|uniref:E3 ubiquitin-protein ligase SDIR1 n=1 Tax=Gracilariopsis chorda TaxID=448386 RepID=A0A2V3JBH8_9FLOR|nr:E3 ubiquitin-protein ligase SDIR1 [Gracilariopsis chorda]|eukprot:PXF49850.1 E3 ubiquitin-protein ligase SDIR1 [Gracilariopsis chorda]